MPVLFLLGFLFFGAAPAIIVETQPDQPTQSSEQASVEKDVNLQ